MPIRRESRFEHELIEDYSDGECIFNEGDAGRDLYIVRKGGAKIFKTAQNEQIEIAEFNKGDFFGDIGLLQSIPRYASANASGDTQLLVLKPAGFLLKIRRDPTFAFEMLQQLSLRVKVSNDRLFQLVLRHNLPKEEVQSLMRELAGKL